MEIVLQPSETERSKVLHVRLPLEAHAQLVLQADAARMTVSEYVRQRLLWQPTVTQLSVTLADDSSHVTQEAEIAPKKPRKCVRVLHNGKWVWLPDEPYRWIKQRFNQRWEWFLELAYRWVKIRYNDRWEWVLVN